MALQLEKYEEEVGSSVVSGERGTKYNRTTVTVFIKKVKKQNKKLKKICKRLPGERRTREDMLAWQEKREEAFLKLLAKQIKKQRKMVQKIYESAEDIVDVEKDESKIIEAEEERKQDFEEQSIDEKSFWKSVKKQMKKREKILNKACKMRFEESRVDEQTAEDNTKNNMGAQGEKATSTSKTGKSFLHKLGDVFLKALPNLLCTIVRSFLGRVFKWGKNLRLGIV